MAWRAHLLEPHAGGRLSGGYLYNRRMTEGSAAVVRHAVAVEALESELGGAGFSAGDLVVMDSLFLTPELAAPFFALRETGVHVGVLLHSLPSFIERARHRTRLARALPLRPTENELLCLGRVDLVVAPGPYVPRLLREAGARVRVVQCPPGVDRSRREARSESTGPARVVSMGGVTPLKGFDDGLRALAAAGSRDFHWTIIGHLEADPEHVRELRELVRALGLEERVTLTGQMSHEACLRELGRSDLLLLPSRTENHPLVALEALAAGVPVVGYAVGGLPDIVAHERTGLLAPVLDVPGLTACLSRALRDAGLRGRLGSGCLDVARTLPSWLEAADHFASALRQAVRP